MKRKPKEMLVVPNKRPHEKTIKNKLGSRSRGNWTKVVQSRQEREIAVGSLGMDRETDKDVWSQRGVRMLRTVGAETETRRSKKEEAVSYSLEELADTGVFGSSQDRWALKVINSLSSSDPSSFFWSSFWLSVSLFVWTGLIPRKENALRLSFLHARVLSDRFRSPALRVNSLLFQTRT